MRVHGAGAELSQALAAVDIIDGGSAPGVLVAPRAPLGGWDEVEQELTEIFTLAQQAAKTEQKLVAVIPTTSLIGRGPVCDAAVAAGLLSGVRALAVEHRGRSHVATVVAFGADSPIGEVAETAAWVMAAPHVNGQVVLVGDDHLGALLP